MLTNKEKVNRNSDGVTAESKMELRQAKKLAKRLAELGLDENGEPLDNYSLLKYPVREWKLKLPGASRDYVVMNPVVTLLCIVTMWALVLWNRVDPVGAPEKLIAWRTDVTLKFTWFYQVIKMIMFFFMMYICYRYGHIRLGRKKDVPEFSTPTYFCMTFVAATGSGLLAYGVSDPLYHRESNFYAQAGYRSQDEIDMFAVNMAATAWSVGSFICIALVAVCMSLAGYRFNLPMTLRSCFYPILGEYTWGWMGDFIDSLSIVAMVCSLCTQLGVAAIQVVTGLTQLGVTSKDLMDGEDTFITNITIWVITIVSTISVISGLRGGIQYISLIALSLGLLLTFMILAMDDTKFLLNLMVQEIGYFFQYSVVQLNFWTDAFGQLREGSGRAVDGKAAEQWWMDAWLIYYYAWVISYSSVVGMFVAYISRGRKIWEVVLCSFGAPVLLCILWVCVWSGVGLRQLRQAMELSALGETSFNNSAHFLVDGSEFCYDVPQESIVVGDLTVFTNYLPGVSPVCILDSNNPSTAAYNIFGSFRLGNNLQFGGLSAFLSVLFVLGCSFFYMSHADSALFIIDTIASNGRKNYHWSRRTFWSCTVAALATTLMASGGDALTTTTSATIVCSLPMGILLCFLLQSVTLFCQAADKLKDTKDSTDYKFPSQPEFGMPVYGGVFNILEYVSSVGKVNAARVELGMDRPTKFQVVEFFKGLVVPFISLHHIVRATFPQNPKTNAIVVICYAVAFLGWSCLAIASVKYPGLLGLATLFFVIAGGILGRVRHSFRVHFNIRSNSFADFLCGTFVWPQVLVQMRMNYTVPVTTIEKPAKANDKGIRDDSEHCDA